MNQTTTTDLAQDLQALEVHLKQIIQSPEFADFVKSGFYHPDFTLVDALHAAQEAAHSYEQMQTMLKLHPNWISVYNSVGENNA